MQFGIDFRQNQPPAFSSKGFSERSLQNSAITRSSCSQSAATLEVLDQSCIVLQPEAFFQDEHPKECV